MKTWRVILLGVLLLSRSVQASSGAGPKVGDPPPLLSATKLLQAPTDAKLDSQALKGKVVVLEFWATWCGPCVAAISHLNELADKFKGEPVQFVAITAEEQSVVEPFLGKRPIHAWVALDTNRAMNKAYAVSGIPHTVVFGKDGEIAAITYPASLTERHLRDLLAGKKISLGQTRGEQVPNQAPNETPALYEISVRPAIGTNAGGCGWGGGGLHAKGCTLARILPVAFDTTMTRIVTNAPLSSKLYDFTITQPRGADEDITGLLQGALKSAFGLTGIKEIRSERVFLLRAKTATASGRAVSPTSGSSFRTGGGEISGIGVGMRQLTTALEQALNQPVLDESGLTNTYDITLKWKESDPPDLSALSEAVRGQLGFELIPAERPVEMFIIHQR